MIDRNLNPKVLISEEKIQTRVKELAEAISADFEDQEIVAVCTLKGGFIFFADIIRKITEPLTTEFLGLSSYGNEKVSSGEVKLTLDISVPLEGKNVVIFEDIVDSGLSLQYLKSLLQARNPKSIKTCSLLLKPEAVQMNVIPDYVGFRIGNEFVVGYGLDYAQYYRGLPYIGVIE